MLPRWIFKLQIRKHKNHSKTSKGAGRFVHILRACKQSQYNVLHCKSRRHNQHQFFRRHIIQYKPSLTNIPYYGLKAKEKNNRRTKTPSPPQRNWMLRALNLCQDTGNNHFSMDSGYDNHSCINLPHSQGLNQVDSNIGLLNEVILNKVVIQPTEKPRIGSPHKSIPKKNGNKRKSHLENKKFRSESKSLYGISVDPNSNNGLNPPRLLLYKSKDKIKYPLMDTSTSIPIVS